MSINIVFYGDCICTGQYVSVDQTWVVRIAQKLREKYPAVAVMNPSTNGFTTRQALDRMTYELSKIKIDVLIVQFGMNDANYWNTDNVGILETDEGIPRVKPRDFEANLVEIANKALAFGAKIIFFMVSQPSGRSVSPLPYAGGRTYQECLDAYNALIRKVSYKLLTTKLNCDTGLIDMDKYFRYITKGNRESLLELIMPEPDWIHLSLKGHDACFKYAYPILESAVNRIEYIKENTTQ